MMRPTTRNAKYKRGKAVAGGAAVALSTALFALPLSGDALACGCLAPPDPSVPLVQAGERLLFVEDNGQVTAHIQVQYSGKPGDFGWLLPLPSIPKTRDGKDGIDVGSDELFTQLIATTQPKYRLQRNYDQCGSSRNTFGGSGTPAPQDAGGGDKGQNGPGSPLVVQDTVGPYDFAVLKADDKSAMLDWLNKNHFIVPQPPPGVDAIGPYIHPGAYFLALKLHAGESAGDMQPVVLRYQSDLPMIPIVLTSVGAKPNMGIQVWMLGGGRAIPRNYYHTVIDDAQIDWLNAGKNYNDVIIKAVGEATGKHSFVTEFAGADTPMRGVLDSPGRFGNVDALATQTDPIAMVRAILSSGFTLNGQLTSLLGHYLPVPAKLLQQSISAAQYYQGLANQQFTEVDTTNYDPAKLAADLRDKIVTPTLEAGKLFTSYPYLTRLYTTLSPEDMNKDPVFSYNKSLPDYANLHTATLTYHCNNSFFGNGTYNGATLITESGWSFNYSIDQVNQGSFTPPAVPYSQRIETLSEVGDPTVVVDNTDAIKSKLGASGCSVVVGSGTTSGGAQAGLLGLLLGAGVLLRRRRQAE